MIAFDWIDWGWGQFYYIEHWVKSAHQQRKSELVCSIANFLDYRERTQSTMDSFLKGLLVCMSLASR